MKGYIFDLDGTLVDSMWVWEDLAAVYLQTKGIKAEENLSKELQLMTMTDAIRYLKEKYVIQDSLAQMRTEVYAIVRRRYRQEVAAKKGAGACLERLHTQGMRIGVLTACERVCAEEVLKRNGLLEYMNFVASCEELPYDKQDGRLFELMPAMLHTDKAETMFVEDALHAVQTLKTHGFHVTAVYDAASKAHWKEICMQADAAFLSLDDLKTAYDIEGAVEHNALTDAHDLMRIHQASLKRRPNPEAVRGIVERKLAKQQEVARKQQEKLFNIMKERFSPYDTLECSITLYPEIVEQFRLWEERDRNFHINMQRKNILLDGKELSRDHTEISMHVDINQKIPSVTLKFTQDNLVLEKKYLLQYRNATMVENILKRMLQHGNG